MPTTSDSDEIFTTWTQEIDDADAVAVYMCGELDASTAPAFLSDMRPVTDGKRDVIMDVHLLTYIDSTGVSALLSIKNALTNAGKQLYLAGCHGVLTKILELTQIDSQLRCFNDMDDAVETLRRGC